MCDALKGAMTKIKMQGLTGGKDGLTWNESGEVTKSLRLLLLRTVLTKQCNLNNI